MSIFYKIEKIAKKNLHLPDSRFRHFSFLTERNKIICWGHNKAFKTHPLSNLYGARFNSIHSELDCLMKFPYRISSLRYYDLINVRIMKDGTVGYSRPCKSCLKLLVSFGVKSISYSTGKSYECLPLNS